MVERRPAAALLDDVVFARRRPVREDGRLAGAERGAQRVAARQALRGARARLRAREHEQQADEDGDAADHAQHDDDGAPRHRRLHVRVCRGVYRSTITLMIRLCKIIKHFRKMYY